MPKVMITGNTRGIGLEFSNYFLKKEWTVVGFNRKTSLDKIIIESENCDLFINNAYADGIQIKFLNELHDKVKKMIVCGSVAAFYPDSRMIEYSENKKKLAQRVRELSKSNILMLHLSAKGYNNTDAIFKILDLWLEHPHIVEIMFDPTGEPNE
jgi:NAD(P)-dependent dehydrogenase (short-subunit alcohol dehydrogenase family)